MSSKSAGRSSSGLRHRFAPTAQISRRRSASLNDTSTHSSYGMRSTRPLSSTAAARHCSGTTPSSGTVSAGSKNAPGGCESFLR
ncbi:hypothetical protein ACSCB1_02605 [Streptomyces europaeiscabiei]|uniref:hypothetical protein n=1 Tax=Streptomyces europaeiscabiei TaxID=146819 RepID=UPI00131C35BF|nr:hypothetical protein [Streptomyces europaeiscabiei]MDX2524697.1 hypothetical protein [Streptomyces europaeiscabiei]